MKKVWKGFAAAVSAAAIAATGFIGATSAYADDPAPAPTTTAVTITDFKAGDEFSAYQVLFATNSGDKNQNYSYTINPKYTNVLRAATSLPLDGTESANNTAVTDYIADLGSDDSNGMKTFADALWSAINTAKLGADYSTTTGTLNVPQGYYLIRQTAAADGETLSRVLLDTAGNASVNITTKRDVPTVDKQVEDKNDSTTDNATWGDSADHDINDVVNYKLTGTVASNVLEYKQYKFEFKDTMSKGLTFKQASDTLADTDVTVKIGEKTISTDSYDVALAAATDTEGAYAGGSVLTITFPDLLTAKYTDGTDVKADFPEAAIEVFYAATLNSNAIVGQAGNPNKVDLTFARDPHHSGTGEPTTTTPPQAAIVFTYDTTVSKTDQNGNALAGAEFALLKWNATTNKWDQFGATGYTATAFDDTTDMANLTAEQAATLTGAATTLVGDKQQLTFKGIDDGRYAIVETKVPAGYNYKAPTLFTVTGGHVVAPGTAGTIDGVTNLGVWGAPTVNNGKVSVSGGNLSTIFENTTGNELPSTGGMGTTILYAAGAAIVLIAGIGLALTLRRRQA